MGETTGVPILGAWARKLVEHGEISWKTGGEQMQEALRCGPTSEYARDINLGKSVT